MDCIKMKRTRSCSRNSHHSDKSIVSRSRHRKGGSESSDSDIDDELLECQSTLITSNLAITTGLMALITGELALESEKMALEVGQIALQAGRTALTCDALEARMIQKLNLPHVPSTEGVNYKYNTRNRQRSTSRSRNEENTVKRKKLDRPVDRTPLKSTELYSLSQQRAHETKKHRNNKCQVNTFRPVKHISWAANAPVNTYSNDDEQSSCSSSSSSLESAEQSTVQKISFISSAPRFGTELTERFLVDSLDLANSRVDLTRLSSDDEFNTSDSERKTVNCDHQMNLYPPIAASSRDAFIEDSSTHLNPVDVTEKLDQLKEHTIDSGLSGTDEFESDSRSALLSVLSTATLTHSQCEYLTEPDSLCTQSIASVSTHLTSGSTFGRVDDDLSQQLGREDTVSTSNTIDAFEVSEANEIDFIEHSTETQASGEKNVENTEQFELGQIDASSQHSYLPSEHLSDDEKSQRQDKCQSCDAQMPENQVALQSTNDAPLVDEMKLEMQSNRSQLSPEKMKQSKIIQAVDATEQHIADEKQEETLNAIKIKESTVTDEQPKKVARKSNKSNESAKETAKCMDDCEKLPETNETTIDSSQVFISGESESFNVKEEHCTREPVAKRKSRSKRSTNQEEENMQMMQNVSTSVESNAQDTKLMEEKNNKLEENMGQVNELVREEKSSLEGREVSENTHKDTSEGKCSSNAEKKGQTMSMKSSNAQEDKLCKKETNVERVEIISPANVSLVRVTGDCMRTIESEASSVAVNESEMKNKSIDNKEKKKMIKKNKSTVESESIIIQSDAISVTVDASCIENSNDDKLGAKKQVRKKKVEKQSRELMILGEIQVHRVEDSLIVEKDTQMKDDSKVQDKEDKNIINVCTASDKKITRQSQVKDQGQETQESVPCEIKETQKQGEDKKQEQLLTNKEKKDDESSLMNEMSQGKKVKSHETRSAESRSEIHEVTCSRRANDVEEGKMITLEEKETGRREKMIESTDHVGRVSVRSNRPMKRETTVSLSPINQWSNNGFNKVSYNLSESSKRIPASSSSTRQLDKLHSSSWRDVSRIKQSTCALRENFNRIKNYSVHPLRKSVTFASLPSKYDATRSIRYRCMRKSYSLMYLPSIYLPSESKYKSYSHLDKVMRTLEECKDRINNLKHLASIRVAKRNALSHLKSQSYDDLRKIDYKSFSLSSKREHTSKNQSSIAGEKISTTTSAVTRSLSKSPSRRVEYSMLPKPVKSNERISRFDSYMNFKRSFSPVSEPVRRTNIRSRCSSEITTATSSQRVTYSIDVPVIHTVHRRAHSELRSSSVDVASSWRRLRARVEQVYPDYWTHREQRRPSWMNESSGRSDKQETRKSFKLTKSNTVSSFECLQNKIKQINSTRCTRSPSVLDRDIDDIDYHIWCARVHTEEAECRQRYVFGSRTSCPSYSRYMPQSKPWQSICHRHFSHRY